MKKEIFILGLIATGVISGFAGAFIYKAAFVNPAPEKLVLVPLTETSSYTLLQKMNGSNKDFILLDSRNKDAYDLAT